VAVKHRSFKPVLPALRQLFSLLARASADNPQQAQALFSQAMAGFGVGGAALPEILASVSLRELNQALAELNRLSPLLKPAIIDASAECVSQNGHISVREYELMRLVADQLDCPMPPLIN
jgi:hypothetical protein